MSMLLGNEEEDESGFAPIARRETEMLSDPHYERLYNDDDWFHKYTQHGGLDDLRDLPNFQELTREMLNQAFLADAWGMSLGEVEETYPLTRDVFALEVLGRSVKTEADFAEALKGEFTLGDGVTEAGARVARGAVVGEETARTGLYAIVEGALRGYRDPYLEKSTQEAIADIPRLKQQIADALAENRRMLETRRRGYVPQPGSPVTRLTEWRAQLAYAELAAQGKTGENILGSLSRASGDLAEEGRERTETARELFPEQIVAAHDAWWVMRVADSVGESAAGTVASAANPVFGLSLIYAQTFENSRAEYQKVAAERGLDASDEAADRYAHQQALLQTPFEIVGDVVVGRTLKGIFKTMPKGTLEAGPETFGRWIGQQSRKVGEAMAGETLLTTPAQTVGEALLAEGSGVRDETTWAEKGFATLDAMSIAIGQVGAMTGPSLVVTGAVKAAKGDFTNNPAASNAGLPAEGAPFDPEKPPANGQWIGGEPGLVFSKGVGPVDPAEIGRAVVELAKDEKTRILGPNPTAKDLPTIMRELSERAADRVAIEKEGEGPRANYTFRTLDGGIIELINDVEGAYHVDSSQAKSMGREIYQTIYAWAHNNGYQIDEDVTMLPDGVYRRNAHMLSSALRYKTTRHMTVGQHSGIEDRWSRNDDSPEATAYNIGLLALNEAELVKDRLKALPDIRYDLDTQSVYDGDYRIPDDEVETYLEERIGGVDPRVSQRVGPATYRRALAVLGLAEQIEQGRGGRLVGASAEAPRSLHGTRYSKNSGEDSGLFGGDSSTSGEESGGVSGEAGRGGSSPEVSAARTEQVRSWVEDTRKSWKSKLAIEVHDSAAAISNATLRSQVISEGGNVEAFFDPNSKTIHLLADRIGSKADTERLMRHEGIHWVVRGVMRIEYGALLETYGRQIPHAKMQDIIAKYPDGPTELWIEEYLAELGESNPQSTVWRQFVSAFKQFLREKFGANIEFTDADVRAFLTRANRKLERTREAEANRSFDGSDASDPLYSKKKKGPQRTSWDQVRKGDSWNSVKKLLPKEDVEAPVFPTHGTKDEIVKRAAEFLKANSVVTDWTGRVVYLPYPQARGSYADPISNRAEHVVAHDLEQGKHLRELRADKAAWLAAVPETIRNGAIRVKAESEILYFRKYENGTHMVVTSNEGVLIDQEAYPSGLVTQYPLDLNRKEFPGAFIQAIRQKTE